MKNKENESNHVPNEWKGSEGKWRVFEDEVEYEFYLVNQNNICLEELHKSQLHKNRKEKDLELFADSLNTVQKCNLMPSELFNENLKLKSERHIEQEFYSEILAERDELLKFIETKISNGSKPLIGHHALYYKQFVNTAQELLIKINSK